jgi:pantoate--beta-alanine ligase
MKVLTSIAAFRAQRSGAGRLALVPTMGALHEGHLSLMRLARSHAPHVAVSIFVNPTQFGPKEDFKKYPRPIEADLEACRALGVDWVFAPAVGEMYGPNEPAVAIDLPALTTVLEGAHRPGHFAGVCQVVAKLFNIVQPDAAVFGRKDFQQLCVLSAMTTALNWPIEIIAGPTVREDGGLAMSSRNRYLSAEERTRALSIHRALRLAQSRIGVGERDTAPMLDAMRDLLLEQRLALDYVAAVDSASLAPVHTVTGPLTFAIAARVGATRLIDNIQVEP